MNEARRLQGGSKKKVVRIIVTSSSTYYFEGVESHSRFLGDCTAYSTSLHICSTDDLWSYIACQDDRLKASSLSRHLEYSSMIHERVIRSKELSPPWFSLGISRLCMACETNGAISHLTSFCSCYAKPLILCCAALLINCHLYIWY